MLLSAARREATEKDEKRGLLLLTMGVGDMMNGEVWWCLFVAGELMSLSQVLPSLSRESVSARAGDVGAATTISEPTIDSKSPKIRRVFQIFFKNSFDYFNFSRSFSSFVS
jgi:hypothetical protein